MDSIVKFKAESGEEVTLSPDVVKRYLVSGDPSKVSDQEVMMFLKLCQYQRLNPFLNEAYLVKFGNEPAQIIVGKDVFMRRLSNSPLVEGYQAGIIVRRKGSSEVEYRNGTFYIPGEEQLLGGWSKIWRKGWKEPVEHTVSLHEYIKLNANKQPQAGWKKAATQIRKVALVQNAREVVPDLRQLYVSEEMQVDEDKLQHVEVEYTISEPQEEQVGDQLTEEAPQEPAEMEAPALTITEKQSKRLFAIAHGNKEVIHNVISKYGYAHSTEIRRDDYEAICKEVEDIINGQQTPTNVEEQEDELEQDIEEDLPF